MKLLTIITPIFNGEKYLNSFFSLIKDYNFSLVDVIIIDDGSTDSTLSLAKSLAKEKNIPVEIISQNNQGACRARFSGILNAKSEFIALLDCDDRVSASSINKIIDEIEKTRENFDIFLFDLIFKTGNESRKFLYFTENFPVDGVDAFKNTILSWGVHGFGAFRRNIYIDAYHKSDILKKEFVNNVNDDELISRIAFFLSRKVKLSKAIYEHTIDNRSTMRGFNEKFSRMLNTSINICKFLELNFKNDAVLDDGYLNLLNNLLFLHRYFLKNYQRIKNKSEWISNFKNALLFLGNRKIKFKNKSLNSTYKKMHFFFMKKWYE